MTTAQKPVLEVVTMPSPIGYLAYQQDDAKPVFFPSMPVLLAGTARWHPCVARIVPVHHADDLLAKEAECEALREDARRLDALEAILLKSGTVYLLPCGADLRFVQVRSVGEVTNYPTVLGLRAAIDAARAAADQGGA